MQEISAILIPDQGKYCLPSKLLVPIPIRRILNNQLHLCLSSVTYSYFYSLAKVGLEIIVSEEWMLSQSLRKS